MAIGLALTAKQYAEYRLMLVTNKDAAERLLKAMLDENEANPKKVH
jgi:hypothetical protein